MSEQPKGQVLVALKMEKGGVYPVRCHSIERCPVVPGNWVLVHIDSPVVAFKGYVWAEKWSIPATDIDNYIVLRPGPEAETESSDEVESEEEPEPAEDPQLPPGKVPTGEYWARLKAQALADQAEKNLADPTE